MRLIDQILQHTPEQDAFTMGMLAKFKKWLEIEDPQCFELDQGVVDACIQVFNSKPTSVLEAFSYARMPYPAIWIERVFVPEDPKTDPDHPNRNKPPPSRVGCLLTTNSMQSIGRVGDFHSATDGYYPANTALASWAWSFHDGTIVVCPFSMIFNWEADLPIKMNLTEERLEYIRTHDHSRWSKYIDDLRQREAIVTIGSRNGFVGNPIAISFWRSMGLAEKANPNEFKYVNPNDPDVYTLPADLLDRINELPDMQQRILYQLGTDLAGEDVLVTGPLLMLNSKNAVVTTKEDLSRLNRARVKGRKRPLTEFVTTRLRIPNHLRRTADGYYVVDRAAARAHMVRGHYKVRKHGVYWWSPHPRGLGAPVRRHQYTVTTPKE